MVARDRTRAVIRAAQQAAFSDIPDNQAAERLREAVEGDMCAARGGLAFYGKVRDSYSMDRAFRLLQAAVYSRGVAPIAASQEELFERERELGFMPLSDAFAFLARHEPRLNDVVAGDAVAVPARVLLRSGTHDDPLVETDLAVSVAEQYVALVVGLAAGDISTSYFGSPQKRVVLSTRFG